MRCGGIIVTDGITTVNPATEVDFTSGATVTDLGGGIAGVAIGSSSFVLESLHGTITHPATQMTFSSTGGTTLFDFSTATNPKPLADGTYWFSGLPVNGHIPGAGTFALYQFIIGGVLATNWKTSSWTVINYGGGQLSSGDLSGASKMTTSSNFSVGVTATDANYAATVDMLCVAVL